MKRLLGLVLMISTVFVLSSCQGINYKEEDYTINGYSVYRYDHFSSEIACDRISQFGLFVRDGEEDYITNKEFGECLYTLFVKDGGTYLNLSEAVTLDLFTVDDVLEVNWDFDVYSTIPLLNNVEFDDLEFRYTSSSETLSEYYGTEYEEELDRLLSISESIYQKFIVDYFPTSLQSLGYIDVYNGDELVVILEVYQEGIYDPSINAFQESHSSELHGLFVSLSQ